MKLQEPFVECRVIWEDAYQDHGWQSHDDILHHIEAEPFICDTLGWLVYRDDKKLVLAMSVNQYRAEGLLTIPAGMIREVFMLSKETETNVRMGTE